MMERRFRARKAFCGSQVRNISCTMADIWKASKYRRLDLYNDSKSTLMDNVSVARCTSGLSGGFRCPLFEQLGLLTTTCYQAWDKLRRYETSLLTLLYFLFTNRSRQEPREKNMSTAKRKCDLV